MKQPKRHHYSPKFYLDQFRQENGLLWVYQRDNSAYREQSTKDTFVQTRYYTLRDKSGEDSVRVEEFLATVEGNASGAIRRVEEGGRISTDDRAHLSIFMGLQLTRTPDWEEDYKQLADLIEKTALKEAFSTKERAEAFLERYKQETDDNDIMSAEEFVDFVGKGEFKAVPSQGLRLRHMLEIGLRLGPLIDRFNWVVAKAVSGTGFITSDSPFIIVPGDGHPEELGVGLLTPGAVKVFPLSPRTCLVMLEEGGHLKRESVGKADCRRINIHIAQDSRRFLAGPSRRQLEIVVARSGIRGRKPEARVEVGDDPISAIRKMRELFK